MGFLNNIFAKDMKKEENNMQYETILLELLARIKKLEDEVEHLKAVLEESKNEFVSEEKEIAIDTEHEEPGQPCRTTTTYTKLTDEMLKLCYSYGKKAYEENYGNLWALANKVARESGMNHNSAFMYIYVVKCMLEGVVYKRAINAKATRMYFNNIYADYGKEGFKKALAAARAHLSYRRSLNHPVDSLEDVCNEYEKKIML